MKKLMAVICAITMLFSVCISAGAANLEFLVQDYKSYESVEEFMIELNKPLDFLKMFNEEAGFDVQYLVEEILKSKFTATVQGEISEDFLKGKVYTGVNMVIPAGFSDELKVTGEATLHLWMEYDFATVGKEKIALVFKNPLNGKYVYFDFAEAMASEGVSLGEMTGEIKAAMAQLDVDKYIEEIAAVSKNAYAENAKIEEDGEYVTISFTNDSFVEMIFDMLLGVMDTQYMKDVMSMSGESVVAFDANEMEIAVAKNMMKSASIFSTDDAYVAKYIVDDKGIMKNAEETIHIEFNICEVAELFGADVESLYPITKENSTVDLTFKSNTAMSKVGETGIVNMPVLTEENSVSLMELMGINEPEPDYDYDYDYQPEEFWDYALGFMDRGGFYVSADAFFEAANWDEDNFVGNHAVDENGNVWINITTDNIGSVDITGSVNNDWFMIGEYSMQAKKPFVVKSVYNWDTYAAEDCLFINVEVLKNVLACKVNSITTYLLDDNGVELSEPECYIELVRPNPGYVAVEYDMMEEMPDFLDAASVGIIGGADGPTEVFVTE